MFFVVTPLIVSQVTGLVVRLPGYVGDLQAVWCAALGAGN